MNKLKTSVVTHEEAVHILRRHGNVHKREFYITRVTNGFVHYEYTDELSEIVYTIKVYNPDEIFYDVEIGENIINLSIDFVLEISKYSINGKLLRREIYENTYKCINTENIAWLN